MQLYKPILKKSYNAYQEIKKYGVSKRRKSSRRASQFIFAKDQRSEDHRFKGYMLNFTMGENADDPDKIDASMDSFDML